MKQGKQMANALIYRETTKINTLTFDPGLIVGMISQSVKLFDTKGDGLSQSVARNPLSEVWGI